jgi:uncharacterized membrane protein
MESKARFLGHSIHQMLVAFPVGLLLASVAFDAVARVLASGSMVAAAHWMLVAGVVGGLVAAPFGLADLMAVPSRTRASRIGAWHGVGNVVALCLFISSWALRPGESVAPPGLAVGLSLAGAVVILMTAWLGGELVSRLGVGVSPQAHVNAGSSLRRNEEGPARAADLRTRAGHIDLHAAAGAAGSPPQEAPVRGR